jgi:hypothetical protein
MSFTNTLENALQLLLFNNDPITLIGDASGILGSSVDGSLYVSLHTADPGEAGDQSTNEATYTSYARVAVARSPAGWTVTGNASENTAEVAFPACTGGSNTITHFGIGASSSGSGKLICKGALGASVAVSSGITPRFPAGTIDGTID